MIGVAEKGIYEVLRNDATLIAALGGTVLNGWKIHYGLAPQRASAPYIVYSIDSLPIGQFGDPSTMETMGVSIRIYSITLVNSDAIFEAVDDALVDQVFDVNGFPYTFPFRFATHSLLHCKRASINATTLDISKRIFMTSVDYILEADKL